MRIIAGSAGGRRLIAPDTRDTRPVTDRAREAVFSSLGSRVEGAIVADLYAGSGSFGLESLSRGAVSATFVESGRKALAALAKNIEVLGIGGTVVASPVRPFLERCKERFDLVFIDPPWPLVTEELEADFRLLDELLKPEGEVVASRRHSDRAPQPPETWRVATDKRYGDTRIFRYKKENEGR